MAIMAAMLWIDWVIALVLGYGLLTGWLHGLVRTLLNLVALVAAVILGPVVRPFALAIINVLISGDPLVKAWCASAVAYAAIYLGLSVLGIIWSRFLAKGVIRTSDKVAGLVLGGIVSATLLAVPLALVQAVPALAKIGVVQRTMHDSKLLPLIRPATPLIRQAAASMLHLGTAGTSQAAHAPLPAGHAPTHAPHH